MQRLLQNGQRLLSNDTGGMSRVHLQPLAAEVNTLSRNRTVGYSPRSEKVLGSYHDGHLPSCHTFKQGGKAFNWSGSQSMYIGNRMLRSTDSTNTNHVTLEPLPAIPNHLLGAICALFLLVAFPTQPNLGSNNGRMTVFHGLCRGSMALSINVSVLSPRLQCLGSMGIRPCVSTIGIA